MYTHILFDLDDTLMDFQKCQYHSFKYVLSQYNISFTPQVYSCYKKINHELWQLFNMEKISKKEVENNRFTYFFKSIGKNINGEQANKIYQSHLENQTWLTPYAYDLCRELYKSYSLYIVTNGVGRTQLNRFNLSEINKFFKGIFISDEIGYAKPNKMFFDSVCREIGYTDKQKILLVGDSIDSDIRGANNFGIDCCWFNPNGFNTNENLEIKYVIKDLRELLKILRNGV